MNYASRQALSGWLAPELASSGATCGAPRRDGGCTKRTPRGQTATRRGFVTKREPTKRRSRLHASEGGFVGRFGPRYFVMGLGFEQVLAAT